jgi:MFS family permease
MVTWKLPEKWSWNCRRQAFAVSMAADAVAVSPLRLELRLKKQRVVDNRKKNSPAKNSMLAAMVLATASLGDAFLYAYLPANYQQLGLSALWVGILLSINRFARLFLNGWVAFGLNRLGTRNMTLLAAILAMISTILYGFMNAVLFWLIARIIWGLSYSALRLSTTLYAVQNKQKGVALGRSKSIVAMGPVLALLIGPIWVSQYAPPATFVLFGILALVTIVFAFRLPAIEMQRLEKKDLRLAWPTSFNRMVLFNALVIDGLFVVLIAKLVSGDMQLTPGTILATTAFCLGYRRICLVLFSPVAGWLADKWGFDRVFNYTTAGIIAGILVVPIGYVLTGLIMAFTFSAMNSAVAPGAALKNEASLLKEISDNATWRDIGAAVGTLIGALFLGFRDLIPVLIVSALLILFGLAFHLNTNRLKSVQWK